MIDISFSYGDLEYFLLILMRVSAFIFVAPFFSTSGVPSRYKAMMSMFFAFILYDSVDKTSLTYDSVFGYALLVIKELMVGIMLGFSGTLCMQIGGFAGQIVDMMTGLSMVSVLDPNTREQVTITGALYQQYFIVMLIISGMHRYLISAIADSFILIPINGAVFRSNYLLEAMLEFLKDYMVIGFRITLPVFIITFVMNMVLGILAKVSPQLNMFAVGIQIKILVGFSIMFLTAIMLNDAADFVFDKMKILMQEFAYGMRS